MEPIRTHTFPPLTVILAVILLGTFSIVTGFENISSTRHTSLQDESFLYTLVYWVVAAAVLFNVYSGRNWARLVVSAFALLSVFRLLRAMMMGVAIARKNDLVPLMMWLTTYWGSTALLFVPQSNTWYRAKSGGILSAFWKRESLLTLITWAAFVASLVLVHFSYWDKVGPGIAAREGNPWFGLSAVVTGLYLFYVYALRSYSNAITPNSISPVGLLFLALAILAVAVLFPAKSLGYGVLLITPLQLIIAVVFLLVLVVKGWRQPQIAKGYFRILIAIVLFVFGFLALLVSTIMIGGIH